MVAEGLRRGDECHNRNVASTASLMGRLAPAIAEAGPGAEAARVLAYGFGNRHFFLPFSIATAKLLADAAHGVEGSPVVTAMCGNGRRLGIRVSGLGDEWFTARRRSGRPVSSRATTRAWRRRRWATRSSRRWPAGARWPSPPRPRSSRSSAATSSPAAAWPTRCGSVCVTESERMLIPGEGFRGTPVGIDAELVARLGIAPVVNNGIAHRDAGVGQVGAGITRLPLEPFERAAEALAVGAVGGGGV